MSITIRSAQTIKGGLTLQGSDTFNRGLILCLDATNPASYPGSGTTWYDLSSNGYNATLYNGASFDNTHTLGAINFDHNSSQYAALASNDMFNGNFSAVGWIYVRSYPSWSRMFDFGNGPGSNDVLVAVTEGGNGLPVYSTVGSDNIVSTSQVTPLNQWTQLAVTQSGSIGSLYVNGVVVASGTNIPIASVTRDNNYIGRSNYPSDSYLDGEISQLRMYNRALSSSEILADYNTMMGRLG
jgi:hypothetical protein